MPIYFLRSTDAELNTGDDGSSNPVIFAAIELDDKAKKELKKHIENTNSISTVTIDGKEYVIVGTVSINAGENGTAPAVRDAFSSFQQAVNAELDEKTKDMTDEDRKATPFVKSDKLSTTVRTIFTGRLEKRENETSGSKKQTVKALLESFDNSPVFFGIALADGVKLQGDTTGDYTLVSPNTYWMGTETNMGSILMYLPRPDGKYYPLVAVRRTVEDWLNDGGDTLLNDVLNGDNKNEYIKRIVDLFNILLNSGNAFQDRMKAKQELARHFLLGKRDEGKQAFYFTDEGVYFRPDPNEQGIRLEGTDNSEKIKHFFDLAAKAGVAFSLSINDRIASKDIIDANILEINLVSPYSFNANFTINSINDKGDYVETKYTGPAGPKPKGPENNPPTEGNTEGLSDEALAIATKPIEKIDENDNVGNSLLTVIAGVKSLPWMQDIYAVMQTAFNSGRRPGQDGCPTEEEIAEALTAMKGMKKELKTAKADLANKIKGCKH